jgi:hypothetical protein
MLHWEGKVGFVGGVTPIIDRHHSVMGAMGERFIFYRLPEVDANQQAVHALSHAGHEKQMRSELAYATAGLIADAQQPPQLTSEETERLVRMSTLVVRARSAIERDGYSRDIELVPEPEAPTRIIVVLKRLLDGLGAVGLDRDIGWKVISKAALDSVPAIRVDCLRTLHAHNGGEELDTNDIAGQIRYPATTTRRALEDLTAHGLVHCTPDPGKAHRWRLNPFTSQGLQSFPEMYGYRRESDGSRLSEQGLEPTNQADLSSFPVPYTYMSVGVVKDSSYHFGKAPSNGINKGIEPPSEQVDDPFLDSEPQTDPEPALTTSEDIDFT